MDADRYFAAEWPTTATRIGRTLARHGVSACDRDDILQETALRLYRAWATVDQDRGVEPFARTIALNVLRDSARRPAASGEVLGDVPEMPDSGDLVERTTIARLELGRVRRALTLLRPNDQRLLTDAIAAEMTGENSLAPAAVRMARMRARRQLVAVLRTASAWAGVLAGLRRVLRPAPLHRAVLSTAAVAAVVAVSLFQAPHTLASPRVVALGPADAGDAANRRDVSIRHAAAAAAVAPVAPRVPAGAAVRRAVAASDEPTPAHIDLPVGRVEVLAVVTVGGVTVEVRDRGDNLPACADSPVGPVNPTVDCG